MSTNGKSASPTPSLPEDVAGVVERLHVIVREPNESTSDLIDRWRKDRQTAAALILSLSSQLAGSREVIETCEDSIAKLERKAHHWEADRDRLAAELERLRELMGRVPTALNSHFSAGMEEREGGSARRQEKLMKYGEDLLSDIASLEDRA